MGVSSKPPAGPFFFSGALDPAFGWYLFCILSASLTSLGPILSAGCSLRRAGESVPLFAIVDSFGYPGPGGRVDRNYGEKEQKEKRIEGHR